MYTNNDFTDTKNENFYTKNEFPVPENENLDRKNELTEPKNENLYTKNHSTDTNSHITEGKKNEKDGITIQNKQQRVLTNSFQVACTFKSSGKSPH